MSPPQPRRTPTQARARATVDAILEAAAQVLVDRGFDGASTNRIAEVAGVSVGTLYQYFPNKDAVFVALIERHCDDQIELLQSMLGDLAMAPLPTAVRTYVAALIATHDRDRVVHEAILRQAMHLALPSVQRIHDGTRALVRAYLEVHRQSILPDDLDTAFYVSGPPDRDALAEEVSRVVLRYLLGRDT
jgi:AcrR family transcriptional regulator